MTEGEVVSINREMRPNEPTFSPAPGIKSYFDVNAGGYHYGGGGGGILISGEGPTEYGYGAGGGGERFEDGSVPEPQPGVVIFDTVK